MMVNVFYNIDFRVILSLKTNRLLSVARTLSNGQIKNYNLTVFVNVPISPYRIFPQQYTSLTLQNPVSSGPGNSGKLVKIDIF